MHVPCKNLRSLALLVLLAVCARPVLAEPKPKPTAALIELDKNAVTGLLESRLLENDSVLWVERTEIDRVLKEQQLQTAFGAAGVKERSSLGKLLKADLLILVRETDSLDKKSRVIECIACETKQGLRLRVAAVPLEKEAEKTAAALEEVVQTGLRKSQETIRDIVAVSPLVSDDLGFQYNYLQSAYAKIIEQVLLDVPGLVVVELGEAQAISRELVLAREQRIERSKVPLHLLGRFHHSKTDDRTTVAIELRLLRGDKEIERRAKNLADDQTGAWLREQANDVFSALASVSLDLPEPNAEARRLSARAEEFLRIGNWEEALALLEASLLLNPQEQCHHDAVVAIGNLARQVDLGGMHEPNYPKMFELHALGMRHLEAFLKAAGKLIRYRLEPKPDFISDFDSPFFTYGNSTTPFAEVNERRAELGKQRREAFLQLAKMRAARGFLEENCFQRAVQHMPDETRIKHAVAFVEEQVELPNLVEIAVNSSPYGPIIFDIPPVRQYIGALAESKLEKVRTASEEIGQLMLRGPKVDSAPRDTRKPPPDATDTNLRPVEFIFDKRPAHSQVCGLLATCPGTDVAWTYTALFRMTEKGKLNQWWVSPQVQVRKVVWDGRYVWAVASEQKELVLAVGDPDSGNISAIGEKEGLPQDGELTRSNPQVGIATLASGKVCLVVSQARSWIGIATVDDQGRPRVEVFHEARQAAIAEDVQHDLLPTTAFNISYVGAFAGENKSTGEREQRVLIGRASTHREVRLRPLIVDPLRKRIENASFTLELQRPTDLASCGDNLYCLEIDRPLNPCLTRIVYPGIKQPLLKDAGQGILWCNKDAVHMVGNKWDRFMQSQIDSSESADAQTKALAPQNLAAVVPWRYMEMMYKPYFGPPIVDSVDPPMYGLLDVGFSHHFGHIALTYNGPRPFMGKVFQLKVPDQK